RAAAKAKRDFQGGNILKSGLQRLQINDFPLDSLDPLQIPEKQLSLVSLLI
ncbi:MAG: hypothetical protein ACI8UO_001722, partial [Verrucomicrobiales bacterium]